MGITCRPNLPLRLGPAAKREWARISKELVALGLLTQLDRAALAAYCQAYGHWREAEKQLKKTGLLVQKKSGGVIQTPWLAVSDRAAEQMLGFLQSQGLTPASRPAAIRAARDNEWQTAMASIGIMTTVGPSKIAAVLKRHLAACVAAHMKDNKKT